MAKGSRGRRRMASRQFRPTPYPMSSHNGDVLGEICSKKHSKALEKKDWKDATCSVCMEYPHNAVLLLCSSHDKGCHPYMCGTSFRYSNCLDQYAKAYTKVTSLHSNEPLHNSVRSSFDLVSSWPIENGVTELACPLCRGQVKGWTVVEPAREYLNAKKRSCMQDNCFFLGTYKELRKHMRTEHPSARPREVDPVLRKKWRRLEREREREDVISTVTASMPDAMFVGDYVIEGHYGFDTDEVLGGVNADSVLGRGGFEVEFDNNWVLFLLHAFGSAGSVGLNRQLRPEGINHHTLDEEPAVGIHRMTPVGISDSSDYSNDESSDEDGDSDNDSGGDEDKDEDGIAPVVNHGVRRLGGAGRRQRDS